MNDLNNVYGFRILFVVIFQKNFQFYSKCENNQTFIFEQSFRVKRVCINNNIIQRFNNKDMNTLVCTSLFNYFFYIVVIHMNFDMDINDVFGRYIF